MIERLIKLAYRVCHLNRVTRKLCPTCRSLARGLKQVANGEAVALPWVTKDID